MITAIISSAVLAAATANAAPVSKIEIRDSAASYVRSVDASGSVVLKGQYRETGKRFRYKIKDGVVTGWAGGKPVRFAISDIEELLR